MALKKVAKASSLQLILQNGVNNAGKALLKKQVVHNLRLDAADEDVQAFGQALAELQKLPCQSVRRLDEASLEA